MKVWRKLLVHFLILGVYAYAQDSITYKTRQEVPVVANTVRPYSNPTETYHYYKLPFCKPQQFQWDEHDLGELLTGSRKVLTDYKIYFGIDQTYAVLCRIEMNHEKLRAFIDAIDEDYIFELYLDDLQLTDHVGVVVQESMTKSLFYLNTHFDFSIAYSGEKSHTSGHTIEASIVGCNISTVATDSLAKETEYQYLLTVDNIEKNPEVVFTYSVKWIHRPDLTWDDRVVSTRLVPEDLEIHWLAITNSFVLVMLLTALLSIIMFRILKRDFSRYLEVEQGAGESGVEEETGWKLVHGDVFRVPEQLNLLSAVVGAGAQLFAMVFGVLVLSLTGIFHPTKRGGVATAVIVLYTLTASVGGFVSARMYTQFGGINWVWNIILCAGVVPGPLLGLFSFLNTVAIWNDSSAALPFGTIMFVLGLFLLITVPLTIVGGVAGRHSTSPFKPPCQTSKLPREIPGGPTYRHPLVHVLIAGCLPFSAVYIELHHIFAAIWGHQIYTLFGILFLAFIMLLVVTSFMTITLTYFQLAMEDHRWWWRSFVSGGVTGFYIFAYSIWYYYNASDMNGFFQLSFFFGYSGMMAYCFFIMLGFIGFQSSFLFVNRIYGAIKVE